MTRRRAAAVLALVLGLAGVAPAQEPIPSLDAALEALAGGEALAGRVPYEVAAAAAERLRDRDRAPGAVAALTTVALEGGAQAELVRALVGLALTQERPTTEVLEALGRVPGVLVDDGLGPGRAAWTEDLLDVADDDDDAAARAAIALVCRDAEPDVLVEYLVRATSGSPVGERGLHVVECLPRTRHPRDVYTATIRLELAPELYEPLGESLSRLVARDEPTAEAALSLAARGVWGWGSVVLRTLGAAPTPLHERVRPFVINALETGEGYHLAAAVLSGTRLRLPELAPLLVDLAGDEDPRVRIAAIRAIPILRERDEETIDLLIDLLSDPAVSKEAHRALLRQTGVRLPLRAEVWREWRERTRPDAADVADAAPAPAPASSPARRAAPPAPGGFPLWALLAAAALGASVVLLASRRQAAARAVAAAPAPAAAAQEEVVAAPSAPRGATRLERLRADLEQRSEHGVADDAAAQESALVLASVRAALHESAGLGAPPGRATGGTIAGPVPVAPVEALRELAQLGRGLTGSPLDTATFDAIQSSLERLEGALPGGGFTEVGRECCFLLLQAAYQLRCGRPLDAGLQGRLTELLADLDRQVEAATPKHGVERTMEVAGAFPETPTVDVATAFAEPAPPPAAPAPTPAAPPGPGPGEERTMDVADTFREEPTVDTTELFPDNPPGAESERTG